MTKITTNQPPATSLERAKDTAKLTKVSTDALRQGRAAESAFDVAFDSAPPILDRPGDDRPQPATAGGLEEQFQLFSSLTTLIGTRPPVGEAAEPFDLSPEKPLPEPMPFAELAQAFAQARGQKLPPALQRMADTVVSRQLGQLKSHLAQTQLAGQNIKLNPQVVAQIKTQVVGPMLKQLKQSLDAPASVQDDDSAANATAPATVSSKDGARTGAPNYGLLASVATDAVKNAKATGGTMDIDQLVEFVIMECGQSSEMDLRDIAQQMQVQIDKSAALRTLQQKQNTDAAAIKSKVDQEYQALVQEGAINPKNCSQTQYENWRPVSVTDPVIDDTTSPPTITYTPPSLPPPDPVNASDLPSSFGYAPVPPTASQSVGLSDTNYNALQSLYSDLVQSGQKLPPFSAWLTTSPSASPPGLGLLSPVGDAAQANANIALALSFAQQHESDSGGTTGADAKTLATALSTAQPNLADNAVSLGQELGVPDNVVTDLQATFNALCQPPNTPPCGGDFNTWLSDATSGLGLTVPVTSADEAASNLAAINTFATTTQASTAPPVESTADPHLTLPSGLPLPALPNSSGVELLHSSSPVVRLTPTSVTPAPSGVGPHYEFVPFNSPVERLTPFTVIGPPSAAAAAAAVAAAQAQLATDANGASTVVPPQPSAGTSFLDANGNQITGNCASLTQWSGNTAGLLQDQSDLTQQMQLKIQIAQQQYSQCMEIVSNILKSDSDTKDAIIKNLTT